jgi:hypothetical protein
LNVKFLWSDKAMRELRHWSAVFALVIVSLMAATPADAKNEFAPFEGPNAERVGEGGTKLTKNGIDYWTTGTPARKYRVLGILTDQRYASWGPRILDSKSVAKEIKDAGGNAAIVMEGTDVEEFGMGFTRKTSRLMVIVYLG